MIPSFTKVVPGEQDGLTYLVMQYVEGGATLADRIGSPIPPAVALRLIGQLLTALEYAHQHGIVHRDIKPANVLMPSCCARWPKTQTSATKAPLRWPPIWSG